MVYCLAQYLSEPEIEDNTIKFCTDNEAQYPHLAKLANYLGRLKVGTFEH